MSTKTPESPATRTASSAAKTFYCVWPEHKVWLGEPTYTMTADGEKGAYKRSQRITFQNQRFTTSDPNVIELMDAEVRRQPMVFSHTWVPNPILSKRDDSTPRIQRGAAVTPAL